MKHCKLFSSLCSIHSMYNDNDCTLFVQLINNHFASYCSKKTLDTGTVNYLPTVCKNTWLQQQKSTFSWKIWGKHYWSKLCSSKRGQLCPLWVRLFYGFIVIVCSLECFYFIVALRIRWSYKILEPPWAKNKNNLKTKNKTMLLLRIKVAPI